MQCDKVGVASIGSSIVCGYCRAKEAWLRLALYQNGQSQFTEAIKRYLNSVAKIFYFIFTLLVF